MTDERKVSNEVLADLIRDAAKRVKAGEEARAERAKLIAEAGRRNLPHNAVAEWADMTRQAVSKEIKKSREQDPTE
ncbi:hypothetical protein AB0395_46265 [Streptosporangium sp. NPDC051023]|uniref:hypothetical protein n=1 Tax=Streptosporangium sp. NPDC051023 TaxID=3155410 RepID=UPI00344D3ABD